MNRLTTSIKLILVVFAIITAGLLIFRVFGSISTQQLKDSVLKTALVTAIITALLVVVLAITSSEKK